MTQRSWTLRRHPDGAGTVIVVTASADQLDELAAFLADAGYYAFAAIPPAFIALRAVAMFDLVAVLGSVDITDRVRIRDVQAADQLVELNTDDRLGLLHAVRERLTRR